MILDFDEEIHRYYVDGICVPSVSEKCSLIKDDFNSAFLGDRTLEDHANEGKFMHDMAEDIMLDRQYSASCIWEGMEGRASAIYDFRTRITEVLATEQVVYHPKYNYIGRVDLVAEIDGEVTLCDWKKGQPSKYGAMTTLLYMKAWNEGYLLDGNDSWKSARKVTRRLVVRPKPDGKLSFLNQKYIDLTTEKEMKAMFVLDQWINSRIR